jgi:hypothetical protein
MKSYYKSGRSERSGVGTFSTMNHRDSNLGNNVLYPPKMLLGNLHNKTYFKAALSMKVGGNAGKSLET